MLDVVEVKRGQTKMIWTMFREGLVNKMVGIY